MPDISNAKFCCRNKRVLFEVYFKYGYTPKYIIDGEGNLINLFNIYNCFLI